MRNENRKEYGKGNKIPSRITETGGSTNTRTEKKPSKKKSRTKQKKAYVGKEYKVISALFVLIFVSLIGYMIYFNVRLSDQFANSPYNKRQEQYAQRVTRGSILASGGEVLAQTNKDEEGNEYRSYPYGSLFAHVVGYTDRGNSGLEASESSTLLSSHAKSSERVQNEIRNQKNIGDNITTTLDVNLQQAAYDALGGYQGAVVAIEPSTGKILAMVSKPDFEPNQIGEMWDELVSDDTATNLLNRSTQGLYPPGSTFKMVTSIAYLRSGENMDDFYFDCEGEVTNGGFTVHCYNNTSHGDEDFSTAFAKSCNSAFAQIGVDLNNKTFRETAEELLFNQELPIEIPYSKGRFYLDSDTADALTMQTAIGQGDTVTSPLHMAMITAAVANGGNMMTPYLVDSVDSYDGNSVSKTTPSVYKRVMTSQEAAVIGDLMQGVVENGTGSILAGQSYSAAGKTGTAEHGDMTGSPHAWFVGYSNVENPDLVVSVIAESAGTGSDVAVPIAKRVFDAYYASR